MNDNYRLVRCMTYQECLDNGCTEAQALDYLQRATPAIVERFDKRSGSWAPVTLEPGQVVTVGPSPRHWRVRAVPA